MLRVAIVGLGDIAVIHLNAIKNSNVELVAACDIDPSKQHMVPNANFYLDLDEMLEKEQLDVVHLCVPHDLHVPFASKCIAAKVHVMLEKPIGVNVADAKRLLDDSQAHPDTKVAICFQNRYNETIEYLKHLVTTNNYGPLKGIKGLVLWSRTQSYYDVKPWRGEYEHAGGGVMINQSIHTLDLIQYFGGRIDYLKGITTHLTEMDIEVEDTACANIVFENGTIANYYATNAFALNTSVEFSLFFDAVTFSIIDSKLYQIDQEGNRTFLCEDAKLAGSKFYYGASHQKCIQAFYQAIEEESDHYISIADAMTSMEMIEAINHSSKTNEKVQLGGN